MHFRLLPCNRMALNLLLILKGGMILWLVWPDCSREELESLNNLEVESRYIIESIVEDRKASIESGKLGIWITPCLCHVLPVQADGFSRQRLAEGKSLYDAVSEWTRNVVSRYVYVVTPPSMLASKVSVFAWSSPNRINYLCLLSTL